jgi:hypothetical protein
MARTPKRPSPSRLSDGRAGPGRERAENALRIGLQTAGVLGILRAPWLVGIAVLCVLESPGLDTNRSLSVVEGRPNEAAPSMDAKVKEWQDAAAVLELQLEELKIAFRKVVADNAELKLQAVEKERALEFLTQNLAVWKTEAELFQQKYEEAQLAAKTSGVKLLTEGERRLQKQLAESVRQLYETQRDRERLRAEMRRLVEVTGLLLDKGGPHDPHWKRLLEAERDAAQETLRAAGAGPEPEPATTEAPADARVLDVNKELQLVVLSLGRANGVTIGMPFLVLRGDTVLAHVKVVDVREKICGALIEKAERSTAIAVGDRVKLSATK